MKNVLKKIGIILCIILAVLLIIGIIVYFFVLQYPELKADPATGKWYRVSDDGMKDSEGGSYHALFKKGSENKVMIYFAGGGASLNEETARDDTYNTKHGSRNARAVLHLDVTEAFQQKQRPAAVGCVIGNGNGYGRSFAVRIAAVGGIISAGAKGKDRTKGECRRQCNCKYFLFHGFLSLF